MAGRYERSIRPIVISQYIEYMRKSVKKGEVEVEDYEFLGLDCLPLAPFMGFLENIIKKIIMVKEEREERTALLENTLTKKEREVENEILEKLESLEDNKNKGVRFDEKKRDNQDKISNSNIKINVKNQRTYKKNRSLSAHKNYKARLQSPSKRTQSVKGRLIRPNYSRITSGKRENSYKIKHIKTQEKSRIESQRSKISNAISNSVKNSKIAKEKNNSFISELKEKYGNFTTKNNLSNETTTIAPSSFRQPGIEKELVGGENISLFYDDDVFDKRNNDLLDLEKFKRRNRDVFRDIFRGRNRSYFTQRTVGGEEEEGSERDEEESLNQGVMEEVE